MSCRKDFLLAQWKIWLYACSCNGDSMKAGRSFLLRWVVVMVTLLLATGLTFSTLSYQRSSDPLCGGRLSAGFPLAFLCDATGESPLSSVGRIDQADWDSINLPGSFVDILFYALVLWIGGLGALTVIRQIRGHRR
jgi:hypothetical protein